MRDSEGLLTAVTQAPSSSFVQGGMLPVLSDVPQMGPQPCSRMYHKAAVDHDAGVMYMYGGVHIHEFDGSRLPADKEPGTVHYYSFYSYTWSTMATTGEPAVMQPMMVSIF